MLGIIIGAFYTLGYPHTGSLPEIPEKRGSGSNGAVVGSIIVVLVLILVAATTVIGGVLLRVVLLRRHRKKQFQRMQLDILAT